MTMFRRSLRYLQVLAGCAVVAGVTGCAKAPPPPPPPPPPTVVKLTITANADANPDARGRASPIVLRVYELKSVAVFNQADFFSLWDREKDTLGTDLVARDEVQLRPGESKTIDKAVDADVRLVAAVAAFRDLERAGWRTAVELRLHRVNVLSVDVGARGVAISPR